MKIQEIITEIRAGKIPKCFQQSSTGLHIFSDGEKSSTDYTHYRLGLALAMSDGKRPLDIDPKTFYGKKHTSHPYTDIESEMLKQGYKAVGADYKDLNNGDMRSMELDIVNKTSPVASRKKNKYGV